MTKKERDLQITGLQPAKDQAVALLSIDDQLRRIADALEAKSNGEEVERPKRGRPPKPPETMAKKTGKKRSAKE